MKKQKKYKRGKVIVAAALLCISAFIVIFGEGVFGKSAKNSGNADGADFVKVLDVGQGDSILIYSNGYSALIDTGLTSSAEDICYDLDNEGIEQLDALIITHLHADHAGGITKIAKRYKINNMIIPKLNMSAEAGYAVKQAKQTVELSNGNVYTAKQGMNFELGDFEITVLAYYTDSSDENNQSVIVMAEIRGKKFLFTGDAETETERALIAEGINVDCDVLKVGHHGSNSSSASTFIKKASPDYAAISVGAGNMYSHPSKKVTDLLEYNGAEVLRTDKNGDILFAVEGKEIKVSTEE